MSDLRNPFQGNQVIPEQAPAAANTGQPPQPSADEGKRELPILRVLKFIAILLVAALATIPLLGVH